MGNDSAKMVQIKSVKKENKKPPQIYFETASSFRKIIPDKDIYNL